MLNFINSIPSEIGWTLVGALGMLALVVFVGTIRTLVRAWQERHEENEEEELYDL